MDSNQRFILNRYMKGRFCGTSIERLEQCSDPMLRFLMRELSSDEGCEDFQELIRRAATIEREIGEVIDDFRENGEPLNTFNREGGFSAYPKRVLQAYADGEFAHLDEKEIPEAGDGLLEVLIESVSGHQAHDIGEAIAALEHHRLNVALLGVYARVRDDLVKATGIAP